MTKIRRPLPLQRPAQAGFRVLAATLIAAFTATLRADEAPLDEEQNAEVLEALEDILIDPDSAVLSELKAATSANGTLSVCGFVNAKNRFGGYTGNKPFFGSFRSNGFEVRTFGDDRDTVSMVENRCQMFGIWP